VTTLTIDTHAFVKRLKAAGAGEELAEAIATGVSEAGGAFAARADLDSFATREDFSALEVRLTNRFYVVAVLIVVAGGILDRFLP